MYKKEIRESKGKSLIEDLKDYTVVDIETTGMNWNFCNILEISSLKIRNKEIVEGFSELINPHEPIPYFIKNLTGITDEMVCNAPELKHHKLDNLTDYYNIKARDKHRALNDCILTNEVYIDMCKMVYEKYDNWNNFKKKFRLIY